MILKGKTVNFLGDSITEGVGASKPENCYCSMIEKIFELKKANNYGIGGTRFALQKEASENPRYDIYFASRIDEMESNADAVVVFGGTNDFGHGDAPIGNFTDRTPDTFYGACHNLFTRLIEKYPDVPIIIVTPLHRVNEDISLGKKCNADSLTNFYSLKDYVDIIIEVARYYSLPVCDLFAASGLQPNVPIINQKYFVDGLHPNDAGHKAVAVKIGRFIENL